MEQTALKNANNKVYHFELHNGKIVTVGAREAWALHTHPPKVLGPITNRPKLVGTSDGIIYERALIEAKELYAQGKKEEAQARLRKGVADEIAEGKLHPEIPPNHDTVDGHGIPVNINDLR